jgi:enediyne biosynthesis protein E4
MILPARVGWLAAGAALLAGCGRSSQPTLFERLSEERTGVTFVNEVAETPELNIVNYLNYYNGGGVAAGDVDGDGLADLYFTSNVGSDRLYRNLGDFRFEDVTQAAGLGTTTGWKSGVTMADVNGDGHLDIYVSTVTHRTLQGRNVLYVNDGDGTFTDRTAEYGLEHRGYSTQAAFFDYDGDGDLDMYLLNHSTHEERGNVFNPQLRSRHPLTGDRLFRNDGNHFVDVSAAAGIYGGVEGYGLGVVVSDLDMDGCPDVYVANDFDEGDFLYHNNCDGTFTESIATATGHTSRASMGVDAADFSNDGRPDVIVLDMLPDRQEILTTSANADDYSVHAQRVAAGYFPQYARNTLQLNRGQGRFSDIGYLAGVQATDWSWAPLFADLDDDGRKDLLVTNGIYRRPNDLDFFTFITDRRVQAALQDSLTAERLDTVLARMPQVRLPNYAFRNDGDLGFTNVADAWGLGRAEFSNGAAYVDLDNDGALDLVLNNLNEPAEIYRNRARTLTANHFLAVRLEGAGGNTGGLGAKVFVHRAGTVQLLEQMPTRGFQSAVDPRLHFGLGTAARVDSLTVVWPDGRAQTLRDVAADQTVTLRQAEARDRYAYGGTSAAPLFADETARMNVAFTHRENSFFDYTREPLLPHQLSAEGPALAVADVNGDGREDVYVGGAKWQAGALLLQQRDGTFRRAPMAAFEADSLHEDVAAALFDADGDGDPDLYVVSAGNEFWGEQAPLRDRLYLNDGRGGYERSENRLPPFFENGACVAPGDFDGDGDLDLFVGSRVTARRYGVTPLSYLLRNDGTGRFAVVTEDLAPALARAGMVTDAAWVDYDGDGALDLIVVGEWMPVRVFRQEEGRFVERTPDAGLAGTNGWWNSVTVTDLQDDGRPDLVLGNLGLNSSVRASRDEPARLYVHDFARNGSVQQILTVYRHGVSYPVAGRDELIRAIPALRDRFPTYAAYGAARVEDIFPKADLAQAQVLEAYTFASALAVNAGDGTFTLRSLPVEAQFAPVYAALAGDFDADGAVDLIVAGNTSAVPPLQGQYDASYGLMLRGDGLGGLASVDLAASNLVIVGETRGLGLVRSAAGARIVVARNDAPLLLLRALRMRAPQAGGAVTP